MSLKHLILLPQKIIKTMQKFGFHKILQKGSHAKYINKKTGKILLFLFIMKLQEEY